MTQLINNTGPASPFDAIRHTAPDGSEHWSARELMPLLGYEKWERFEASIERAIVAMNNQEEHGFEFGERNASRWWEPFGKTERANYVLTRFGAYMVAMNGDPRKPEVAAAQAYFAIRTREAEVTTPAQHLSGKELLAAAVLEAQSVMRSQELYIEQADKYIEELQPKADYVDMYVADDDLLTIRQVAKSLGVQEKAVRKALLNHNWIYQEQSSRWSEKEQRKVDQYRYSPTASKHRYFRTVQCHDAPRFKGQVDHTLKINPQGAKAIGLALKKWGLLSDPTVKDAA